MALAHYGGFLLAENQVYHRIVVEVHQAVFESHGGAGNESQAGLANTEAVFGHEVEGIAGYHVVHIIRIAPSPMNAGIAVVVALVTGEGDVTDIGHGELIL